MERIRDLRKQKKYNQTYIANILRVSQTTYSDYEKGRVRIPINHIVELARFYNVDLNYITGASNIREPFPM
jgi:transcriptional regulator with XRE-family HTH domain